MLHSSKLHNEYENSDEEMDEYYFIAGIKNSWNELLSDSIRNTFCYFYQSIISFFNIFYIGLSFIGSHLLTFINTGFTQVMDKCGRKRIILDRESNEPYLERYYLFLTERESFPFNIFIIHPFLA